MNLERFIAALGPGEVLNRASVDVLELAYDTSAVRPGSLFFCVLGSRADGHDLAPAAVAAGAVALVVERPLELDLPQLVVPDSRAAMAPAAVLFFGDPTRELEVAGMTGTNGKTTTAFLLHAILEAAGRRPGLLTNIERRVGGKSRPLGLNTPEAIDLQRLFREMLVAGDRSCVMEATSIAQTQGRLAGTRLAVLVFTNLSPDHLDFHGTMDEYFAAKRALFEQADRAAVGVAEEHGRRLAAEVPDRRIVTADNPRSEDPETIAADVAAGISGPVEIELDRRVAIERALEGARPGDVVVIAGRGAEPEQELATGKVPFDDREVTRDVLRRAATT